MTLQYIIIFVVVVVVQITETLSYSLKYYIITHRKYLIFGLYLFHYNSVTFIYLFICCTLPSKFFFLFLASARHAQKQGNKIYTILELKLNRGAHEMNVNIFRLVFFS